MQRQIPSINLLIIACFPIKSWTRETIDVIKVKDEIR